MRLDIAAQSDIGRRKEKNEDSYGVFGEDTPGLRFFEKGALLCVADGLGGHVGGEIASRLAVSVIKELIKESPPMDTEEKPRDEAIAERMVFYTDRANSSIHRTNRDMVRGSKPMGTTLLTVFVEPEWAHISNVGDSRCYLVREGSIVERTEDHSWVDEQVKLGLMSRAEAERDSRRNMVTRSVGTHPNVEIDSYKWAVQPGDMLLLCTDGLINMVKDVDIQNVFRRLDAPADIAHELVHLANEHGGKDNITVIVANLFPSTGQVLRRFFKRLFAKHGRTLAWLFAMALVAAGSFAAGYYVAKTF